MNWEQISQFIRSKTFIVVVLVIFGLAMLAATFSIGALVGFHKARFTSGWNDNYERNFGGPRGSMMMRGYRDFSGRDLLEAHGTAGQIIKIDSSSIVIRDRNNTEKVVNANADTVIREMMVDVNFSDLKVNDAVTVIGEPNTSGQIDAKFIRVMPMNFATPTP